MAGRQLRVSWVCLRDASPLTQRLSLIRMKDRYLSHYSKYFLEILLQYFSDIEHIHLTRKV